MKLSIIVVSYNTKELLKKCLESLVLSIKNQVLRAEIIIVDNGSTDGSVEMVKETIIHLIENKENLGFAKAVNQALRQAQGKVILLLNSDTQVKSGALEKLLEFEEKVSPAIIGLRMLNPDGSIQGSVFNFPTVRKAIEEFWLGKKGYFSKFVPLGNQPVEVEVVSGGAMAISREVLNKLGSFDERYFMYFEDLDFCRRAKKRGFKVYYFPSAEIIHEHGASGKHLANSKDQWKRLIPSSKIYHGFFKHFLITSIIQLSQKLKKLPL